MESPEVKAITTMKNLCQLQLKYKGHASRGLALTDALKGSWAAGVKPLISRQASHKDSTIIDIFISQDKSEEITQILKSQHRSEKFSLESHRINERNLSSLTIVGAGFDLSPELLGSIGESLEAPRVITMQISDHFITYICDKIDLTYESKELHDKLLK